MPLQDFSSVFDDIANLADDGLDRFISSNNYAYSSPLRLSQNSTTIQTTEEREDNDCDIEQPSVCSTLNTSEFFTNYSCPSISSSTNGIPTSHSNSCSVASQTAQGSTNVSEDYSARGLYHHLIDTEILGIYPRNSKKIPSIFHSSHATERINTSDRLSNSFSRSGMYGNSMVVGGNAVLDDGERKGNVDVLSSDGGIMNVECALASSSLQLGNSTGIFGSVDGSAGGILVEKRKRISQSVLGFSSQSPFNYINDYNKYANGSVLMNRYSNDPYALSSNSLSPLSVANASSYIYEHSRKHVRKICKSPFKVLDAPSLVDDFYLNLVDWSSTNILAVGLGTAVYLWSTCTSKVTKLLDVGVENANSNVSNNRRNNINEQITSVSWSQRGDHIAVGMKSGRIEIWDIEKHKRVRKLENSHTMRVGTLAWNGCILSSGSRDQTITNHDVREHNAYLCKWLSHKQEVCGLKWAPTEQQLASGGNDNKLVVWQLGVSNPVLQYKEHAAAIKALAWSPHKAGLLASGGGTADRCIRFYDTIANVALKKIDTGSQVCNLAWSKNINEIVSTHGYSLNQVIIWRCPSMQKISTLIGHTYRVLYLAVSPDGQTIVTGAGDETLRFWNVFPPFKSNNNFNNQQLRFTNMSIVR